MLYMAEIYCRYWFKRPKRKKTMMHLMNGIAIKASH